MAVEENRESLEGAQDSDRGERLARISGRHVARVVVKGPLCLLCPPQNRLEPQFAHFFAQPSRGES